jgi:hypothetical protein
MQAPAVHEQQTSNSLVTWHPSPYSESPDRKYMAFGTRENIKWSFARCLAVAWPLAGSVNTLLVLHAFADRCNSDEELDLCSVVRTYTDSLVAKACAQWT